jgi:hypothetical protein
MYCSGWKLRRTADHLILLQPQRAAALDRGTRRALKARVESSSARPSARTQHCDSQQRATASACTSRGVFDVQREGDVRVHLRVARQPCPHC